MLRIFTKVVSLGLIALLLLALPMVALGEAAAISNAPAGVNTAWGDALPVAVAVTSENGDVVQGALEVATADVENLRMAGTVELNYAYGATNMPANILYHALLNLNEGALIRVEGDSLKDEVMEPGTYTVVYTHGDDELACTVLVRGAVTANVIILDYEVPLSDGKSAPKTEATPEPVEAEIIEEEIEEPVPEVEVLN